MTAEKELIARSRAGDADAFAQLVGSEASESTDDTGEDDPDDDA